MRLLDLFCKAGGAGMGYHRAGFEVVGVDIEKQKRYPFAAFVLMDAIKALDTLLTGGCITDNTGQHWYLADFYVIHASPPCQANSALNRLHKKDYPQLIEPTRERLRMTGKPYVIENVEGAPLQDPILLCGSMFDLKVYRHRLFEIEPWILALPHVSHNDKTPAVGRGTSPKGFISVTGDGGFGIPNGLEYARAAMGIDWMSRTELSQAIPPAYTEWIGRQLINILQAQKAA